MNKHDMVIDIKAMLKNAEPPLTADCCIYKVPLAIRRHNDDAYTPKVISIGPFHHRHPRLQNMERHKLVFFEAFLKDTETTLEPLIDYIDSIIPKFRSCYSETLEFRNQELVKLILIDSVFIIQLFRSRNDNRVDAVRLEPYLSEDVTHDLLLLENQLPFFIVEEIFKVSFTAQTNSDIPSFHTLTFDYFKYFNKSKLSYDSNIPMKHFPDLIRIFTCNIRLDRKPESMEHLHSNIPTKHCTDLIRSFHLQHPFTRRRDRKPESMEHLHSVTELLEVESMVHLHSVTELLEAGVRFKPNTTSKCLLDLRFLGEVFEIPQLKVDDWTEILFQNMVALEQCLYPEKPYITDYIQVLDFLINTGKDVDILVQKGILVNWLGDNDSVAKLVNSLGKNVVVSDPNSDYLDLYKNLNDFYNDRWHKLKATLMRDYCSTPWQTAASVAAILLLILSILQSVCSVVQIVKE